MTLAAAVRLLRAPEMVGSDPQRLRSYLVVDAVVIWAAALSLTVALLTLTDSPALLLDAVALVVAGVVVLVARWLAERGRTELAAVVVLLANWGVALALAWFSPFVAPVAVLALLVPLLVVAEHLPTPARSVVGAVTIPLSGLVAFLGEWRRTGGGEAYPGMAGAVLVGVLVSLVVLVLALGLRDYARRLGRRTRELEESRARLAGAALEARRGIERDLHDGAQQRLATLAVDLGRANRLCEDEPARAREIVHGLQRQLEDAIRELRDLAHGIYPPALGERGLEGALPAAARRTTLPCVVETRGLRRYGPQVEAAAYFCCLEAMHNADRHSGGSLITVVAEDDGAGLRFSVTDDGAGFDQAAVRGSHGLTGMRDRIRAVGGELDVASAPGEGTRVEGVVPPVRAR